MDLEDENLIKMLLTYLLSSTYFTLTWLVNVVSVFGKGQRSGPIMIIVRNGHTLPCKKSFISL